MAIQERRYTITEFEAFIAQAENENRLFELINGMMVEKTLTWEQGVVAGNSVTELNIYLRQNPIGLAAVEARHRPVERESAALYMPDLAIEIKSPTDSLKKMLEHAEFYLANGARMVWLIYPEKRIVEVVTADDRQILTEDDMLEGGDVLPGFAIPVSAFRGV